MSSQSSGRNSRVFLLVFIGVAVVAWALLLATVGKGFFSFGTALSLEGGERGTVGVQRASELLENDLRDAEQTSLIEGAGWAPSVTLSWTDRFRGLSMLRHVVQYTLQDDRLMRIEDGIAEAVAEDVLSTRYSLAGGDFSAVFEIRVELGVIETVTLRIAMP